MYLLLKRHQAHTREEVASLLWEDADAARSKAYLRKALWHLQATLGAPSAVPRPGPIVEVDGEWLRLHPDADLWLDVAVMENAYARSRGTSGADLQQDVAVEMSDALALYSGDLLPNRYQNWCLEERERIKHLYLCMLEKLLEHSRTHGEYEAGLAYGRGILGFDSTREHVHRQLMRLHCLRGDRAGALRQYGQCAEALERELGVSPMRETSDLHEHIRNGDGDVREPGEPPAPAAGTLQDVVVRLDDLQVILDEIRRRVEDALRSGSGSAGHR